MNALVIILKEGANLIVYVYVVVSKCS
jgi:hypothetical protein